MSQPIKHRKKSIVLRLAAFGAVLCLSGPANAQPVYNRPIYNPESKSYFELYSPDANNPAIDPEKVKTYGKISHPAAARMAARHFYHGVRGRLAVIGSKETHEFLVKNLRMKGSAWIGLRYYCNFRKFIWVTGKIFKLGRDFARWGPRTWNVEGGSAKNTTRPYCPPNKGYTKNAYFGVHYWGKDYGGYYWNANGFAKHYNAMIIEYPTGKP